MKTNCKNIFIGSLLFILTSTHFFAQLDYHLMDNWVFHPHKSGTLIDGYNLDIAVIDENLHTDTVFHVPNNAMTNTGVDVFFVHPTLLSNMGEYTTRENIPLEEQPTWLISASVLGQAGLLAKYGRFFAPHYRQATPPTYLGSPLDSTQAAVIEKSYQDIKAAFLYYLDNYNEGNKIILASHSQGAYLSAMLLRDVFDNDVELQNKLVTAVIAGVVNTYATPFQLTGGWWQNILPCTAINQCGCVMTWRSYKEGQSIPNVQASAPCFNPYLENNNFVYRLLDVNQDWVMQDSMYYSEPPQPLRHYLVPKTNQPYGGNVGFVAFDSLYQIKYQRTGLTKVGFMVKHTPKPNEQRPNNLAEEESNPLFNYQGYHSKDYAIYMWALLAQIDSKLENCATTSGINTAIDDNNFVQMFPNPANKVLHIQSNEVISKVEIFNTHGQLMQSLATQNKEVEIVISKLPSGFYFVKTRWKNGAMRVEKLIKE